MLTVVAIEPAIEFYRDVLGFQCVSAADAWACISLDGVEVMFALPNQHLTFREPMMTGSPDFKTHDVEAYGSA